MRLPTAPAAALALALLPAPALAAPGIESHGLEVRLDPAARRLEAQDRMTVRRDGGGALRFELQKDLEIVEAALDGSPVTPVRTGDDGWAAAWSVPIPGDGAGPAVLTLRYAGTVSDGIVRSEGSFVVGDRTRGLIEPEGAYLSESTAWYPVDGGLATFDVTTHPVDGWEVVTQGTRTPPAEPGGATVWNGKYPADGLSLVAGPWKATHRRYGDVEIGCYLGEDNAAGAEVLLDHAARYLKQYGELLGPYAYDRFDVVENFFTTGYGMPEFTLLGGNVIARMLSEAQRKGEIPAGYLDHEIVHCWWGNSVYPDYATGNWCEALTTYCANYHAKEVQGAEVAAEHRRQTSLRFALRVHPDNDYPVRAFRGKTEAADDDIGYGKGSMFFHSLRRELGEDAFWGTLREVAATRRGQRIGWEDWRAAFEKASQRNLAELFAQGLDRTGAPLLSLSEAAVKTDGGQFRVTGVVRQRLAEGEAPWRISVPVEVEHLGGVERTRIDLGTPEAAFSMVVPSMPVSVSVDPTHEVFRTLSPDEIPPCLAATLERPKVFVVYPDGDEALEGVARTACRRTRPPASCPRTACRREGMTPLAASAAPKTIGKGASWVLLGDAERNPLLGTLPADLARHFPPAGADPATTMVLASSRNPADGAEFLTTAVGSAEALAARGRYVFYYQFDGRVQFAGPVPRQRSQSYMASRTTRRLLPELRASTSAERARTVIDRLAAPEMKGRLAGSDEDRKARRFVADELRLAGVEPDEAEFSFSVKRLPEGAKTLARGDGTPVEGAVPLVASPETAEEGVPVLGSVGADDDDVAGRALVVDLGAGVEDPLAFLREVSQVAVARRATALLVRVPADAPQAIADLWAFPERLHADVSKRLEEARARGGDGDAVRHAAGTAARIGSDAELPLPTAAVPADFAPAKDEALRLTVRFGRTEVRSANLVARIRGKGGASRAGTVVLGAHLDHLGEGFPGADDNASGVAALLEAVQALTAQPDLLARDLTVVVFGAEEWGLRGSRAFLASLPEEHGVVAMVNADTVGRRGIDGVSVVGITHHPRLGRIVAAAVEQAELAPGREIDQYAFAHGSDHWTFHVAGIPAVDLWSGDYQVMHTQGDTADGVDAEKVAKVGRALALSVLAAAGGW